MARFSYSARDGANRRKEGFLEAESISGAISVLRRQSLLPIAVRPVGQTVGVKRKVTRGRVGLGELALFARECATMLEAGVPIVDILEDLASETTNRYFATVLGDVRAAIQAGSSLSQAMGRHPTVFSRLIIALVKSGEESGHIVQVMQEIAGDLEDQITLLRKFRQAIAYPTVIVIFFIAVVAFVFLFLIPKFETIFKSFGADLPLFTKVIMAISGFMLKFAPFLAVALVVAGILLAFYARTPSGRRRIDRFKISVPVLGKILLKVSLARFARSFATLIGGGVAITVALEIVGKTAGNAILEDATDRIRRGIIAGNLVGQEMRKEKLFPSLLVRMVSVGEETGKMDDMLVRASRFFRDEVDATLSILTSILEPLLIIGLGFVVGVVVLAIYLPIFKLAAAMH